MSLFSEVSYIGRLISLLMTSPRRSLAALLHPSSLGQSIHLMVVEKAKTRPKNSITIDGMQLLLDPDDTAISAVISVLGQHEPAITRMYRKLVSPGDTVLDVGANIGWFSIIASGIVGDKGRVVSLEPEHKANGLLRRTIKINGLQNIVLLEACLSETDGHIDLYLEKSVGHSIKRKFIGDKIETISYRLDTLAADLSLDTISVLKVDVEGAEPEVLEGARTMIEKGRVKNILLEWNPEVWAGRDNLLSLLFAVYQFHILTGPHSELPALMSRKKKIERNLLPNCLSNLLLTSRNCDKRKNNPISALSKIKQRIFAINFLGP